MSDAPGRSRARASRANARKSTGPKSAAGKARVARNARRHGLTVPLLADEVLAREVDDLARRIEASVTGAALDGTGHALACRIAETLIDLRRVRSVKLPLVAELAADLRNAARPLKALARLDRYERLALSRRKIAVRAFDAFAAEHAKQS
ncbi:MAG TPA: hypothetical protein VGG01_24895 [Xanthobacteraceae bacterium]|jgi:hypothetical protein